MTDIVEFVAVQRASPIDHGFTITFVSSNTI